MKSKLVIVMEIFTYLGLLILFGLSNKNEIIFIKTKNYENSPFQEIPLGCGDVSFIFYADFQ